MTSLPTLLVDGTDLRSLPLIKINRFDLFAPGIKRGNHDTIPGRQGQLGAQLPTDAYQFAVEITVDGGTEANLYANLHSVASAIVGNYGLVQLERRLPNGSGGYDSTTANGQFFGGLSFQLLNVVTGKTELTFVNLDGGWWNGTHWVVP